MKHKHNELGYCDIPCPWCGVYGFYSDSVTKERAWEMCKWCHWVKNHGERRQRVYHEICPRCWPNYKQLEKNTEENVKRLQNTTLGDRSMNTPKKYYGTLTMSPGHPCAYCETEMVKFEPKYNILQKYKDDLYKHHRYD